MKIRVALLFFSFLFSLFTVEAISARQAENQYDILTWNSLSEANKQQLIHDLLAKSSDRIRWSHEARMEFANLAYQYSILHKNENLRFKAMNNLAELYFNEARFRTAMVYFDSVIAFAERTQDHEMKIEASNFIGAIFRYQGELYEGLDITHQAYKLAQSEELTSLIALSANNLGVLYRNLGENKLALGHYQQALELASAVSDTNQIVLALSGLGNFHWFEKELTKALEFYNEAMVLAKNSSDLQHIAFLNNNIGNIYRESEDYETALFYYNASLDLLREVNVVGLRAVILRNIGLVYQRTGYLPQAINYLQQSQEIVAEIGIKSFIRDNYLSLSQIYQASGNLQEAYQNLQRYTELNQQIYNSQLMNRITYFNEKIYDAQQNEENYKFRFERNALILIFAILFLLFISLFSVLMFLRFRDRRKHIERLRNTLQDKIITEKALRQSEENYQTLIKTLNEGLLVLDSENKIEFVNLKGYKLLGAKDRNGVLGKSLEEFLLTPEDVKLFKEKVELQKMGISDHYEIKMKSIAGDVMWANLSSAPILDENLKTKGCVALITDITEKKKSEQTYSELTANLNQKIKQLNCLYDITDLSGVPGITFEEIMEKSLEIIPVGLRYSHDIGVEIVFDKKAFASKNYRETPWSYSVPIKVQKKKLGYIKVCYLEEKPNINKDPFHFNEKILLKNISEKFGQIIESKHLERVLRDNREKLQEVQQIAKIGNWEKNLDNNHCEFSETFFDIADITPERRKFFDYTRFLELIHPDDKQEFLDFEKQLVAGKLSGSVTANYRIVIHTGAIRHIFSIGKIIKTEDSRKGSCVFTVQDITEQKHNQELQHHAELALKTSEAKQQVLANMSFEMRTPITGIMGMVDFLQKTDLNSDQIELVKTIKDSSINLLNIVNNILDLQRIEAGKFRLNKAQFDLNQLMDRVNALFAVLTRNKELELSIHINPDVPVSIVSDQARLYQVISSLVAVIAENTDQGKVDLVVSCETLSDDKIMMMMEIFHVNKSFDIDAIKNVLKPARGQEDTFLHKRDNLIVGLNISRRLVEMLEGSLGIDKSEDNRIAFYFTFLASTPQKSTEKNNKSKVAKNSFNIEGLKVLCVEDQKINQKVISLMLVHARCEVSMAANGQEALDLLTSKNFDVVLLDMVMPVMDGIETLKVMKQRMKSHPPVIALSANVLDEDKDRYFKAGVNDFISKPINAPELYEKIHKWHYQHKPKPKTNGVKKKRQK